MSTESMRRAILATRYLEGGWYAGDDPRDPNPTMEGVTQKAYEAAGYTGSVRFMTAEQREAIYRKYWDAVPCDLIPAPADALIFDHAFNAGPEAARKVLQRAMHVTDDGILGPVSRGVLAQIAGGTPAELDLFAHRVLVERLRHYIAIARNKRLRPNLYSWMHRLTYYAEQYL